MMGDNEVHFFHHGLGDDAFRNFQSNEHLMYFLISHVDLHSAVVPFFLELSWSNNFNLPNQLTHLHTHLNLSSFRKSDCSCQSSTSSTKSRSKSILSFDFCSLSSL